MAKWYATCEASNYDEGTGVCSQVVYVEDASGWLPELSHQEGADLGAACFGVLALAFLFRLLFKKSG